MGRGTGHAPTGLHVREHESQNREALVAEGSREPLQERVIHPCPGTVRQHDRRRSARDLGPQAGDLRLTRRQRDGDADVARAHRSSREASDSGDDAGASGGVGSCGAAGGVFCGATLSPYRGGSSSTGRDGTGGRGGTVGEDAPGFCTRSP